jgi:Ca2+-binding RTX toxin-like protein
VLASDSESKYYLHNAVDLDGGVPPSSCTILGTANAETISGTSADDVICAGGGNDTLDGGTGTDTASYSASLTAVNASLATNSSTGEGSDTFLGVESLLGSSKADTLTGRRSHSQGVPDHPIPSLPEVDNGPASNPSGASLSFFAPMRPFS